MNTKACRKDPWFASEDKGGAFSVAILAKSTSLRMGKTKGLLPIGGKPILQRMIQEARHVSDDVFLVTNSPRAFSKLKIAKKTDCAKGFGPLCGICTALQKAKHSSCVMLSSDMPFITRDFLRSLHAHLREGFDAVVPYYTSLHPLCAIYRNVCVKDIKKCFQSGDLSLKHFVLQLYNVKIIRDIDKNCLYNINTWDNYNEAEKLWQLQARAKIKKKAS